MRRITLWLVSTVAVVVLLFSYRTSTMGAAAPNAPGVVGAAPGLVSSGPAAGSSVGPSAPSGATVVNGTVVRTRWGPVQVQVTISGRKITDVVALQVPSGNRRDREINDYAVPLLHDAVLQAQSADIDSVSGATVTSDGYRRSLQAALDAAHFGS
ncbi:FMN-binding protein [Dactylosporangium sp. AC04546]|uniref:FMN-binding protein n=1 Tax=Dactylosporangium sp. AC04546 TaxID=2862460 RepID=UPI001EDF0C94|nr:FMN-binding protein [Dactylosporangium sp. AC04546]WVK78616.1 FMN-binding protein [Dactylosporangium sp. AC04546]